MHVPARLSSDISAMVLARDFAGLRQVTDAAAPVDIAEALGELDGSLMTVAFRILPKMRAAEVFEYLPHDRQESLVQGLGKEEVAAILNAMSDDDRTAFLEEVPEQAVQLLGMLSPEEQRVAVKLLGYAEGSVGRLMTTSMLTIRPDWAIDRVFHHIREKARDVDYLNVIFVTDERGVLLDAIRIREFLVRSPSTPVSEFRQGAPVSLKVSDSEASAVEVFRKYDRTILPVVDEYGVIVGIVTVDDVLDVATEEATKDIQQMGGSESLDDPYLQVPMVTMLRKRAGWLIILFISEMLTATAMAHFEDEIEKAAVLAIFTPLIISSGGNSGSQSSTLIIRAMSLGEVELRDWWRVLRREIAAGSLLGLILGAVGCVRISLWQQLFHTYDPRAGQPVYWQYLAATIFVSLIGVVLWGSVVGAMMPFLLRRLGFDPATSSAPFVATLVDVTGLTIYFSAAYLMLRGTLL